MNPILRAIMLPIGIGVGALLLAFIAMMSSSPLITSIFTAVVYLAGGFWMARLKINGLWYAPLFANAPIWIVFIPMGMQIWPPAIQIWYFLIPPAVALVTAYIGLYVGARVLPARVTADTISDAPQKNDQAK